MTKATPRGAHYLDSVAPKRKSVRSRLTAFVSMVATLAVVGLTLGMGSLATAESTTSQNAQAVAVDAGGLCNTIGSYMEHRGDWRNSGPKILPDVDGRYFAMPEVAGNGLWWSTYQGSGTGNGEWFITSYDEEAEIANAKLGGSKQLPLMSALSPELQPIRSFGNCFFVLIPVFLGNIGLNFAGTLAGIVGWVATSAFNPWFICDADAQVAATQGACIDLVSIIGGRTNDAGEGGTGEGSQSGIIGTLTSGIYKPLVVIVVIVTAMLVFWTGIIKRQFRQALGQAVWLLVSFLIGLALILNPSMLVRAPMVAGNTLLGCITAAFTGSSGCFSGTVAMDTSPQPAARAVCVTGARGASPAESTAFYVQSMACSIWSAFVLEPYARGAFGTGLSGLDMNSPIDGGATTIRGFLESPGWNYGNNITALAQNPGNADNYCVQLGNRDESYNTMPDIFVGSDGPTICNLAVWDLMMKVNYTHDGTGITIRDAPDATWFELVSRLPSSEQLFGNYTNSSGAGWNKMGMGTLAWIAVMAGGFLIVLTSLAALVYYVMAMLMVAFAPIFFLIGMHPGRGKKMMLGWVEQIISNFLKYLVSGIFVLVAITFYGAILGSTGDLWGGIIFIVLLTAALLMYRRELVNMLGRVEMGGEKMTDATDSFLSGSNKFNQKAKRVATGVTAGALAGLGTRGIAGMGEGIKTASLRELRANQGIVGRTLQSASALSSDNKQDARNRVKGIKEEAAAAAASAAALDEALNGELDSAQAEAEDVQQKAAAVEAAEEAQDLARERLDDDEAAEDAIDFYNETVNRLVLESDFGKDNPQLAADYSNYLENMRTYDQQNFDLDQMIQEGADQSEIAAQELRITQTMQAALAFEESYSEADRAGARDHRSLIGADAVEAMLNDDNVSEDDKARMDTGYGLSSDVESHAKFYQDRVQNLDSFNEAYAEFEKASDAHTAALDKWDTGAGLKIKNLSERVSAAKNNAEFLSAQFDESSQALDAYTAGDIRSTAEIERDLEKAKARAADRTRNVNFNHATQMRLDEVQAAVGQEGFLVATTLGEKNTQAQEESAAHLRKVERDRLKKEQRDRNREVRDAARGIKRDRREESSLAAEKSAKETIAEAVSTIVSKPIATRRDAVQAKTDAVAAAQQELEKVQAQLAAYEASGDPGGTALTKPAVEAAEKALEKVNAELEKAEKRLAQAEKAGQLLGGGTSRQAAEAEARLEGLRARMEKPTLSTSSAANLNENVLPKESIEKLTAAIDRYNQMANNASNMSAKDSAKLDEFAGLVAAIPRNATPAEIDRIIAQLPSAKLPSLPRRPVGPANGDAS